MTRRAFRFLGHMASRTGNITQGVAQKNLFQVVLQAGVNVLEMTGEIIRYNETTKQTAYIQQAVQQEKIVIERRLAAGREEILLETDRVRQQALLALQLEEKKLHRKLEDYKQKLETRWLGDQAAALENYETKSMLLDMLRTYNDVLDKCEASINQTVIDDEGREALYEQFRLIYKQVHKIMQEVQ